MKSVREGLQYNKIMRECCEKNKEADKKEGDGMKKIRDSRRHREVVVEARVTDLC
jgi:hypothetical protein